MDVANRRASWLTLFLAGLGALLASILGVFFVVFVYAFVLAFQARGAPDTDAIQSFANTAAPFLGPILLSIFALAFSFLVLRSRPRSPFWYGIIIGFIAATPTLVLSGHLEFSTLVSFTVPIVAASLGAVLATGVGLAEARRLRFQ